MEETSLKRYEVIRELGRGGMGIVYQAMDTKLQRMVAVKLLLESNKTETSVQRFVREAEISAKMAHPHIVQVHDIGTTPQCYIVMEYIEGRTLHDLLKEKNYPFKKKLEVFQQVCEAVEYAHKRQIIHRDLKPQNIMVMEGNQAKVMDFGLAKSFGIQNLRLSKTGQTLGTPQYMSPEQADGSKLDHRSDIYSLGVILYEILTGRTPYQGDNIIHLLDKLAHDTPTLPKEINPSIPQKLQTISMKCLEKNPQDRYESVQLLHQDIQAYLENKPLVAKASPTTKRTRQWMKNNKSWAGMLMVLVLGVIFLLFSYQSSHETTHENNPPHIQPPPVSPHVPPPVSPHPQPKPQPALTSPYHLPLEVWKACKYEYNGEVMLDMTTDFWCSLSASQQSEYAGIYQQGYAAAKQLDLEKTIPLPNLPPSAKPLIMRLIPPGRFWMGSPENEAGRNRLWTYIIQSEKVTLEHLKQELVYAMGSDMDEGPRHRVVIPSPYYLAKYECTQAQWQAVMGNNPARFPKAGQDAPVEQVSWNSIAKGNDSFCGRTKLALPSEAHWEYGCRAGTTGMSYAGDFQIKGECNAPGLSPIAWYGGNSSASYEGSENSRAWPEKEQPHQWAGTHTVGQKFPNGFGIYDMLGNVSELSADNPRQYNKNEWICSPPKEKKLDGVFMIRGGGWNHSASNCRAACRNFYPPINIGTDTGFRLFTVHEKF